MSTIDYSAFDVKLGIQYSDYASELLESDYWIVKKSFTFVYNSKSIVVPKGYLTDGASVPRFLWGFIPPWGKYGQSCVLHDYLCEYHEEIGIENSEINKIFYAAMKAANVPLYTRAIMYIATEFYRNSIGFKTDNDFKRSVESDLLTSYNESKIWN